jgi:hypothetical protein
MRAMRSDSAQRRKHGPRGSHLTSELVLRRTVESSQSISISRGSEQPRGVSGKSRTRADEPPANSVSRLTLSVLMRAVSGVPHNRNPTAEESRRPKF